MILASFGNPLSSSGLGWFTRLLLELVSKGLKVIPESPATGEKWGFFPSHISLGILLGKAAQVLLSRCQWAHTQHWLK